MNFKDKNRRQRCSHALRSLTAWIGGAVCALFTRDFWRKIMRRGFHWVFHVPPVTRTDWIVALLLFIAINFMAYLASYELFMIKNPRILENANR